MAHTFQPFFIKNAKTKRKAQKIKPPYSKVISTLTWLTQKDKARKSDTVTMYPPNKPAEIFAKRCKGEVLKYFLLAGIFLQISSTIRDREKMSSNVFSFTK